MHSDQHTILLVDDSENDLILMRRAFKKAKCKSPLQEVRSGFDVLAWVRAQPVLKRLAIFILTASNRSEDVDRAFDLGATSFLIKPIGLEALASMLRRVCDWAEINRFPALHEVGGTNQATIEDPGGKQFQ